MQRNTHGNGPDGPRRIPPADVDDALQFTPLSSVVPFAAGTSLSHNLTIAQWPKLGKRIFNEVHMAPELVLTNILPF